MTLSELQTVTVLWFAFVAGYCFQLLLPMPVRKRRGRMLNVSGVLVWRKP